MHICSFTNAGVTDLKKSARNENGVLNALNINPRVSTFDMSENRWLCDIIDALEEKELIIRLNEPYPWHKWILTDEGKAAITV